MYCTSSSLVAGMSTGRLEKGSGLTFQVQAESNPKQKSIQSRRDSKVVASRRRVKLSLQLGIGSGSSESHRVSKPYNRRWTLKVCGES